MKHPVQILAVVGIVAFALGFALGALFRKKFYPCTEITVPTVTRDTVTTVDTIKYGYPVEVKKEIIRTDTVRIRVSPLGVDSLSVRTKLKPSTSFNKIWPETTPPPPATAAAAPVKPKPDEPQITPGGNLAIPIERKTYQGEDYKAVVEGWRPSLASIEVYPKTVTVTEKVVEVQKKRPVWALVVGPGVGYNIDGKLRPGINATFGLNIISK